MTVKNVALCRCRPKELGHNQAGNGDATKTQSRALQLLELVLPAVDDGLVVHRRAGAPAVAALHGIQEGNDVRVLRERVPALQG